MGARGTNSRNGKAIESAVAADSAEAAEEAGLQYVNDDRPGYSRKAKGKDFEYLDTEGKTIRDEQRLLRIKRLAIPPAWTEVWICPSPNGHIQATGRDARGRKQYRYHERWREVRDENKFGRLGTIRQSPSEYSPASYSGPESCRVCRGKKCSQQLCGFWSDRSYASETKNTRARTSHSV